MKATAVLSDCGTYRYCLTRDWHDDNRGRVCWVMLNPSTADAEQDDPTIRRCVGFSNAWGYSELIVVNLFALRSTDPRELYRHHDPVGPMNNLYIDDAVVTSDLVVCAWGAHGILHNRGLMVLDRIRSLNRPPCLLGVTKKGQPKHPLYLRADLIPVELNA